MFDLIVIIHVPKAEDIAHVADALARMRPLCLAEDGCVSWEAYQSHEDAARFVLVERWASRDHWGTHDTGAAIQDIYIPEIMPRIEREVHPSAPVASV